MKIQKISFVTAVLLFVFSQHLHAFLPGGELKVTMSILVNPVDGVPTSLCDESETINVNSKRLWWFSIGKPAGFSDEQIPLPGSPVKCGAGTFAWPDTDAAEHSETPYFVGAGLTSARIIPQMEDERVVELVIASQLNSLQQIDRDNTEEYLASNIKRNFQFSENREVFIPLLVATSEQRKTLGIQEVFLRVALTEQLDVEDSIYGKIWVSSDFIDADVLLDGGKVGNISASGELFLRNIKIGLHEVSLRSSEGIQSSKVLRVIADRTVLSALDSPRESQFAQLYQLELLEKNKQGYKEYRRAIDGAVVIKIPEGEFLMGNTKTERSPLEHNVYLSTFLMDKTGVTWGQYKLFAEATGIALPPHDPYWGILDDHPAAFVTWEEADNYCQWAGGRLPTEAEREKAARGTDGRKYPWGNEEPRPELAIFRKSWGYHSTGAVGQHPDGASPYGLLDVGGNVWEWCADWYDRDYYEMSPYRDPKGPAFGTAHVVRGGSWDSRPTVLSSSCRSWGHQGYRDGDFGFRCAMNSPK